MTLTDTIASHPALITGLQAAVPLWMMRLAHLDPDTREQVRARWVADAVNEVAFHGDTLQFGGKRGEAARVFNALARGLAALAYQPGGVTALGGHWCANHRECVDAEQAAGQPIPDPEPTSAATLFRGRLVETVHPSAVL